MNRCRLHRRLKGCACFFAAALFFVLWPGQLCSQQAGGTERISCRNFGTVKPGFYRGGKPSLADLERLRELGVKTVIDFTMANRVSERKKARELGMRYVNIPWDTDTWLSWFYDYDRVAVKFISLMDEPANYPVFVHCFHGRDRTGTMVALYRIRHDGWSHDEALAEMKRYGFDEKKYPNLVSYLKKVSERNAQQISHPHEIPPPMSAHAANAAHLPLRQHSVEERPLAED